jgi:heme/copper-type cytochrome/quinol oxidase subunit 2
VIVALTPSQTVSTAVAGVLFFLLIFLSGLWVQPAQAGEPLRTIMYYSPSGAATRALLDSAFTAALVT